MAVLDYPALRGHESQGIKTQRQELLGMSQGFIRSWFGEPISCCGILTRPI